MYPVNGQLSDRLARGESARQALPQGVCMSEGSIRTRALFLSPDGKCYPDGAVCGNPDGGVGDLRPCPHSDDGRLPPPERVREGGAAQAPERGRPGDFAPPCVIQHFGNLQDWQGPDGLYSPDLHALRVFRCRKWFLLVVPGIRDDRAGEFLETV